MEWSTEAVSTVVYPKRPASILSKEGFCVLIQDYEALRSLEHPFMDLLVELDAP